MQGDPSGGMGPELGPVGPHNLLVTAVFSLLLLIPFWRTYRRAGFSPWTSLLVLIPYVGLPIAAAILAFRPWPAGESRRIHPPQRPTGG